jgi:hypothetical protein
MPPPTAHAHLEAVMNATRRGARGLLALGLSLLGAAAVARAGDPPPSFRAEVAPILVRNCLPCHREGKAAGGLSLATFAALRAGGKTHGAEILVPGDPEASALVASVAPDAEPRMPHRLPPLRPDLVATLARWVAAGARFDGPSEAETPLAALVDPLAHLPEVAVRSPAPEPARAVAFTPDGTRLVVGRGAGVEVLDATSGRVARRFGDFPGPVTGVRVAADGRAAFVAGGRPGQFGSLTFLALDGSGERHEARAHRDAILAVALSPDGRLLATASYDRTVALWDVATRGVVRTLAEHTDAVHGVAFSPDGTRLASASGDRTIKVWEVATGRRLVTLGDATAEQYAVRFTPDGGTILGAGADRTIRAWRVEGSTATLARRAIAHDAAVLKLAVTPDGRALVSCGEDRAVKVWDLPSLAPRRTLAKDSGADWPLDLALRPDGARLAVAGFDGRVALVDRQSGRTIWPVAPTPTAARSPLDLTVVVTGYGPVAEEPPKPQLARPASLAPPAPRGGERGKTVRVTLTGHGVGQATAVVFPEGQITPTIVPAETPDPGRLTVDLAIAADAAAGGHRFLVRTPMGVPPARTFVVSAFPESTLAEPDADPAKRPLVALPATLLGAIEAPGDVDGARFAARRGEAVVFETLAVGLGSALAGVLRVRDADGRVLAESPDLGAGRDPALTFTPLEDATYTLEVADAGSGGSAGHFYRITAGVLPRLEGVWPRGVAAGGTAVLRPTGANLGGETEIRLEVPASADPGTLLDVAPGEPNSPKVVVAEGEQGVEIEGGDDATATADSATAIAFPGGISGRIDAPGDVDTFRFEARRGRRVIVEAFAGRLGVDLDLALEILDRDGRPIPRAVLRPVGETNVAFRDHAAAGRNLRLTTWDDLAVGDHVLIGREVLKLAELPRNPDDDAIFWGLGHARKNPGARLAALETTPEHHPLGQPIWKVEVHPPGATFPAGRPAPVVLSYRNDDGGPGFAGDPRVTFDPPADGVYLVRVEDLHGQGGRDGGYHVVVRSPRPDFTIRLDEEELNLPRGGTALVTANVERRDGFEGPVAVALAGLPPGVTASATTIEPGLFAADLVVTASDAAETSPEPTWRAVGRAGLPDPDGDGSERDVERAADPGGPGAGWVTIGPGPNLRVRADRDSIRLRPGETTELTLSVERSPAFTGRVPIEVRNLPMGVKVLDIGLNGVLVTESQATRTIVLRAEPWASPLERPITAVGRCEPAGTEHPSAPIGLVVEAAGPAGGR